MAVDQTPSRLAFLQVGQSTEHEIRTQLGDPYAVFEDGRITAYRLSPPELGLSLRPRDVQYSLILVFDARRILERWRLVRTW